MGDYFTRVAVLTAYSESDFVGTARSKNPTSSGYYSEGIFQQTLPWWKNDHWDPIAATNAFLDNVRKNTGDPIKDAWDVQHWNAPDFRTNLVGFWTSKETVNYIDHQTRLDKILETGRLP